MSEQPNETGIKERGLNMNAVVGLTLLVLFPLLFFTLGIFIGLYFGG